MSIVVPCLLLGNEWKTQPLEPSSLQEMAGQVFGVNPMTDHDSFSLRRIVEPRLRQFLKLLIRPLQLLERIGVVNSIPVINDEQVSTTSLNSASE